MTNLGTDSGPNYLWKTLLTEATNGLERFLQIGLGVLDKLVPLKKKYLSWINHLLEHIWKELAGEIDF